MKILTLCDNCRKLYEDRFSVKKYSMATSTTKTQEKCENCGRKSRCLEMFIIDRKGK